MDVYRSSSATEAAAADAPKPKLGVRRALWRKVKGVTRTWRLAVIDHTPAWARRMFGPVVWYFDMLVIDHGVFRLFYVNRHRLGDRAWRSAQPAPHHIRALKRRGLRTIINLRGELIGLTTTASVIAGHEQPAGYAIPMSDIVRRVIDTLKNGREVEYGMLGVGFGADPFAADATQRPKLRVAVVYPTGPAARAGLQPGDVITGVNRGAIESVATLTAALSSAKPPIALQVQREGRSLFLLVH